MLVTKRIHFHMGHRIPNHNSKCFQLHGHTYNIEVGVDDKVIDKKGTSSEGMVIDFSVLKKAMVEEIYNRFDHKFMFYNGDKIYKSLDSIMVRKHFGVVPVEFIPTAENMAEYIYDLMKRRLEIEGVQIKHVTVWETPTSSATFTSNDEVKK